MKAKAKRRESRIPARSGRRVALIETERRAIGEEMGKKAITL
jgi:hypothetical protein